MKYIILMTVPFLLIGYLIFQIFGTKEIVSNMDEINSKHSHLKMFLYDISDFKGKPISTWGSYEFSFASSYRKEDYFAKLKEQLKDTDSEVLEESKDCILLRYYDLKVPHIINHIMITFDNTEQIYSLAWHSGVDNLKFKRQLFCN